MIGPKSSPDAQPKLEALYKEAAENGRGLPAFKDHEYMLVRDPLRPQQVMLIDRIAIDTATETFGYLYNYSFWPVTELAETVTKMMLSHKLNLLRTERMFDLSFNVHAAPRTKELEETAAILKHDAAIRQSLEMLEKEGIKIDHFMKVSAEDQIQDMHDYFNQVTRKTDFTQVMVEGRGNVLTERPMAEKEIKTNRPAEKELAQNAVVKSLLYTHARN